MNLGEKIQQLRKAAGISQEQLAEQLEVSRQSVSKWERNDAAPEISKIILLSELFAVSTDELLKGNSTQHSNQTEEKKSEFKLKEIAEMNAANKQANIGFKTMVAGLIMLVLEFMFLPIFGSLQKTHVNGQGFYSDFIRYAEMQPMPTIFALTIAIIVVGVGFLALGLYYKKKNTKI